MNARAIAAASFVVLVVGQLAIADELAGVWKAKQRFGPDARGPLIIEHADRGWIADFIGEKLPVAEKCGPA